jgi:Ran GTPase-activating protein (RanGAP) involved in mRNA processing and transport
MALLSSLASGRLACARLHVAGRLRGESLIQLGSTMLQGAKLHRLELAFADVGDASIAVLAPGVAACGLRELCLRGNSLTAVGATVLARAMADPKCRLEHLVLGSNNIGDAGATALAALLRGNITLSALDVSGNGITAPGAVCLAAGLTRNRTLTHLNLDFNAIGPTGAAALAAALPHSGLVSLELEWNGVKDAGATTMAFALHATPASTLRHLGLASNGIRAGGAILLAGALRGSGLRSLVLAGNALGLGALTLAAAVRTATQLRVLDLTSCGVGADAQLVLASSLAAPGCALSVLRLGGNNPGFPVLTPFAEALSTNAVLEELEFTMVQDGLTAAAVDVTLRREPGPQSHWRGVPSSRYSPHQAPL